MRHCSQLMLHRERVRLLANDVIVCLLVYLRPSRFEETVHRHDTLSVGVVHAACRPIFEQRPFIMKLYVIAFVIASPYAERSSRRN